MILYHGGKYKNLEKIIDDHCFCPGFNKNTWSGTIEEGLYCSNIYEYAAQYGDDVIEIDVADSFVEIIQNCPLSPGDHDWKAWMKDAVEYLIPTGITFEARWAKR